MKTKKVHKKRLNFKKLIIFLLFLYLIFFFVKSIFSIPIKNIVITGTDYLTDELIINNSKLDSYPSLFKVTKRKIKKNLSNIDLVKDIDLKKSFNGTLTIIVKENKPLFLNLNIDKYILLDGKKINGSFLGVPTLLNYVPDDIYKKFIKKLATVSYENILLISEIEYSPSMSSNNEILDEERFLLRMNDGNTVYINVDNLNNLNYYKEAISPFDYSGILYLDTDSEDNFLFSKYKEG